MTADLATAARAESLELFWGRTSPLAARVYARWFAAGAPGELRLSGQLEGPRSPSSATLEAVYPFVDLGPGPAPLAEAIVTEPCFWTPREPFVYRATVEARSGRHLLARVERTVGIRPLGPAGRNLFLAAKRWVLRGIGRQELRLAELEQWLAVSAAAYVPAPCDEVCRWASQRGLVIAARTDGSAEHVQSELRRLARWPAVMLAVLPDDVDPAALRGLPPVLLLAQRVRAGPSPAPRAWAQVLLCDVDDPVAMASWAARAELPVIARRPADPTMSLAAARAACDRLQRDLAPWGDFAGYLV